MKVRIGVLVTGGGTNLQALIDSEKSGIISDGEIVVVVASRENAYALTRAQNCGIPHFAVPRKGAKQADFEDRILKILKEYKVDLVVLAGFLCILSENFIAQFPNHHIINIHPALLPSFCGKGMYGIKVHEEALSRGVKVTGATVHYVNSVADGGEIIYQKAVKVMKNDTAESLQLRVMKQAEWILLPKAVKMVSKQILKEKQK